MKNDNKRVYLVGIEDPPKRPVSIYAHLFALHAATNPYDFMPAAGQDYMPGPPAEIVEALKELQTAAGKTAAAEEAARKMAAKVEAIDRKMAAIRAGRSKGGRASKHRLGLQAVVDRLVTEHPKATARDLWNLIPESEDAAGDPVGGFIVYRDGSKVIQVEDETGRGRDKAISFRSFCRYITRARSK